VTHHITAATSVDQASGNAFEAVTFAPDTLIVDRDAHLASFSNGDGAELTGTWTVVLNGKIRALGGAPANLGVNIVSHNPFDTTKITIGRHGLLLAIRDWPQTSPRP
jgi:hypothetical protein